MRHLALTVSDVCLKLGCFHFQSTTTYCASEISHFMRYITPQNLLTYSGGLRAGKVDSAAVDWCSIYWLPSQVSINISTTLTPILLWLSGGVSVAVPGEVAGYHEAWKRFGRLPWRRLVQPTIDMCRHGYHVTWILAHDIRKKERVIRQNPSLRYRHHWCVGLHWTIMGVKLTILVDSAGICK